MCNLYSEPCCFVNEGYGKHETVIGVSAVLWPIYSLLTLQDGLTGERRSANVHSVPLVGGQQSKLVLDTKPVEDSEEPG